MLRSRVNLARGWQDGFMDKGAGHHTWPEFESQNRHGGRTEQTPASCALTLCPWHCSMCAPSPTHMNTKINRCKKNVSSHNGAREMVKQVNVSICKPDDLSSIPKPIRKEKETEKNKPDVGTREMALQLRELPAPAEDPGLFPSCNLL